jgi:uncharacterized protein (TIGR02757 family)
MGANPAEFVRRFDGASRWPGFYHRFHKEGHVVVLVRLLQQALREYGSLSELFRQTAAPSEPGNPDPAQASERALAGATRWLRSRAFDEVVAEGRPELLRGMKFFFNSPDDGSACKRMVMFLRWMVRRDEIDLGLWTWLKPSQLVIPADTHVARIAYYLRLRGGTEKAAPNWKMAREITASLRAVNAEDPTGYDFALARLGILDICKRTYTKSVCERCPVAPACRFAKKESPKKEAKA